MITLFAGAALLAYFEYVLPHFKSTGDDPPTVPARNDTLPTNTTDTGEPAVDEEDEQEDEDDTTTTIEDIEKPVSQPINKQPVDYPGEYAGPHKWLCGRNTYFDLLIDGPSVKLGPKIFNSREIEQLKTTNSSSGKTTYQLFVDIDEKTKMCEFDFGTFETEALSVTSNYTGSHVNGIPDGVGRYENGSVIRYATLVNNEYHGFRFSYFKAEDAQYQYETRSNERDGLSTIYFPS